MAGAIRDKTMTLKIISRFRHSGTRYLDDRPACVRETRNADVSESRSIYRPLRIAYRARATRRTAKSAALPCNLCAVSCPVLGCISLCKSGDQRWPLVSGIFALTAHAASSAAACAKSVPDHGDSVDPGLRTGRHKRQDLVCTRKEDLLISGRANTGITTGWRVWQSTADKAKQRTKPSLYRRQRACYRKERDDGSLLYLWPDSHPRDPAVITHTNPVHALLYLVISLLAISGVFTFRWALILRCVGNYRLRRRHHGAVCVRGDDAQPRRQRKSNRNASG